MPSSRMRRREERWGPIGRHRTPVASMGVRGVGQSPEAYLGQSSRASGSLSRTVVNVVASRLVSSHLRDGRAAGGPVLGCDGRS
jgi:hypothetical protein